MSAESREGERGEEKSAVLKLKSALRRRESKEVFDVSKVQVELVKVVKLWCDNMQRRKPQLGVDFETYCRIVFAVSVLYSDRGNKRRSRHEEERDVGVRG